MHKIAINKENMRILGIVQANQEVCYLDWSASGLEFETDAQEISIELEGQSSLPEDAYYAWLGVFVDGVCSRKIRVERERKQYTLYQSSSSKMVKIRILKLTEKQYDRIAVMALYADRQCYPTREPNHRILFIGDSITAGYGVDGQDGISTFTTKEEDVTKTYAFRTAETLDADCHIIAWSGNGIISRWIPPERELPDEDGLMPDIFPYGQVEQPDIVVSYLGTNDASYTRKIPEREKLYAERYSEFLNRVRTACPGVPILLLCGLMENTLNPVVAAVAEANGCEYLQFALQEETDGIGTDGHPGPVVHQKAAQLLTERLKKMM